jgi:SnoaL-like domain
MKDKLEITETFDRYFAALDTRMLDPETFRRIFADHATIERPNGTRLTGPEEISSSHANSLERFRATQHLTGGCIIDPIDESTANFRLNLVALHLWKEGFGDTTLPRQDNFFLACAVISGSVIKTRESWRISKLRNDPVWIRGVGFQEMMNTK